MILCNERKLIYEMKYTTTFHYGVFVVKINKNAKKERALRRPKYFFCLNALMPSPRVIFVVLRRFVVVVFVSFRLFFVSFALYRININFGKLLIRNLILNDADLWAS